MKSIRQQFLAAAIAIVIFLIALGFFTRFSIRHTMEHNQLSRQLDHLAFSEVSVSKTERDFLLSNQESGQLSGCEPGWLVYSGSGGGNPDVPVVRVLCL